MRPIAALLGTDINITTSCRCMRIVQYSPEQLVSRFGADATLDDVEGRLRCKACGQRPKLICRWSWGNVMGLGRGVKLPDLPEWTGLTPDMARAAALRSGQ
ncbi:hypothetical protein CA234_03175 [Sphingomonas sp. ABOLE]|uniref:hypothetical protein n=1 Tax=Sphingomonas sp. ABOLE TaxID=1985878 RepID=UPI000F7DC31E|nr:hypothetical protein [Sphingomonas sp. ABOLE]RSV44431.1 hypothetical protein CA234_03175 [Sphingomonas sp. ABOLE]